MVWHTQAMRYAYAGRIGRPEDIAEAVLFLADSSKAGFITGQELSICGGVTAKLVYPE